MAFKDDIKLDLNHLDKNAIDQVPLYEEYSRQWADAVQERDRLKERLSIIKAEVDEAIRANPSSYGWLNENKSPTEAWVANQIILSDEVKKATQEFLEAQNEVNIMAISKETLEHRRFALGVLTELYKGQYFVCRSRSDHSYKEALEKDYTEKVSNHLEKGSERRLKRLKGQIVDE